MAVLTESSRVKIRRRDATDDDMKSQMYFTYYGGLSGAILKVYSPAEVSVEIDHESLTREVRNRHEDVRNQMKTKWLDGLSEEGRSRLTEREKNFFLRYVVLVSMDDLEAGTPRPESSTASQAQPIETAAQTAARLSSNGLTTKEEEILRSRSTPNT